MSEPSARLCPYCYAGTPREATTCWMCRTALPPFDQRPPADEGLPVPAPAGERRSEKPARNTEPDFVLWAVGAMVAVGLMGVIVAETAYLFGGIAVLVVAVCVPVLGVLGRMVWVRRPRGSANTAGDVVHDTVGIVAIAVVSVATALGIIFLAIIAIIVLLVIACFTIYYGSQILH